MLKRVIIITFIVLLTLTLITQGIFAQEKCPKKDATHRYLKVPVSYDHPNDQSFQLYYELNSDFDPAKPVLFYVTDGQQPMHASGEPDKLKQEYRANFNIIQMEHRGMPCSFIKGIVKDRTVDWKKAYFAFRSDNVVKDIEKIRKDVIKKGRDFFIYGGSGGGTLSAQYLAKYSQRVKRAFLERTSDNMSTLLRQQKDLFFKRLKFEGVYKYYLGLMKGKTVPQKQLLWILQRVGYDYYPTEHIYKKLLGSLTQHDLALFDELSRVYGTPEKRVPLDEIPFAIVRIFEGRSVKNESSIPIPNDDVFSSILNPLEELSKKGIIPQTLINVHKALAGIETEIFLAAARWDHVLPFQSMEAMNKNMPNSRLIIYDDTHKKLLNETCHHRLFKAFFEHGKDSNELKDVLSSGICRLWKK